jgi:hypothetical protein
VTLEEDVELQGFGEPQCAKLIAEQVTAAFIACSSPPTGCKGLAGVDIAHKAMPTACCRA